MKTLTQIALVAILVALVPALARASVEQTFGFYKLTNNGNPDVASQLSVKVYADNATSTSVNFRFFDNVGIASSITQIYFDDGTLLGISSITDSGAGVNFDDPATPGNLPSGNTASPPFVTTAQFSAGSGGMGGVSANGVNSSTEWVDILFDLINGKTYTDTIAALEGGTDLRIGLHVQAIGTPGGSDSYITTTTTVTPEPGTIAVWGLLAITGYFGMKKYQAKA